MNDIQPSPVDGGFGMLSAEEVARWEPVEKITELIYARLKKETVIERFDAFAAAPNSNVIAIKVNTGWGTTDLALTTVITIVHEILPNSFLVKKQDKLAFFHISLEDIMLRIKEMGI